MINFVVVSHSYKLAQEAINLTKKITFNDFKIVNAAGMPDNHDEIGTDAQHIMNMVNFLKTEDTEAVIIFCELGSSLMSSQMVIEMLNDPKVILADAPLVEGLIVAASSNYPGQSLENILNELEQLKSMSKI
ncbi:dihydroxyacetone kinase phosphoryl donor subunit DhaM [Mycoplasmopsis ciconiae]|uniref:phosphoenolpyruvate--glycerone phosphotransferase n=1 Tax=Mycoplasmopsis ciconiae TaxID=561067 RepID=A0ABU7MKU8_9BACT|nr:dihydroxyacetone kinase phosphoryl donor subunit DhaM [Mycoplasmopsis ciconiae]